MARILTIGDLHIKTSNIPETRNLSDKIIQIIEEYNPDLVVILGDTLHRHNIIDMQPLNEAIKLFKRISVTKKLIVLIGNHDISSQNLYMPDAHPFRSLKEFPEPNITVVDTKCEVFEVNGLRFAAVPYVPPGRFNDALKTNEQYVDDSSIIRCIFAHQEFRGCKMNVTYSKGGDIWENWRPLVISGHIHEYQRLGPNIVYVGTPRQTSFVGSIDVVEMNTYSYEDRKTISLFTITNDTWEELRIPTLIAPRLQFNITPNDIYDLKLPNEGVIKVKITGTYTQNSACRQHPIIHEWEQRGITVTFKNIDEEINVKQKNDKTGVIPTFQSILYNRIKDDEDKMYFFKQIFS